MHHQALATTPQDSDPADAGSKPPLMRIEENTTIFSQFNVMPGRPVEESLFMKEYRIGDRYIEATFDRAYKSSMINSPDHLIFITALAHTQKLLYTLLCHEFGIHYDPHAAEKLKIWPTRLSIQLPKLIRKTNDVIQTLTIEEITKVTDGRFQVHLRTVIEETLVFEAEAAVFLL